MDLRRSPSDRPGPGQLTAPAFSVAARLPQELVEYILHLSAVSTRPDSRQEPSPWRATSHPPLSSSQLARLCLLSHAYHETFARALYRSVVLRDGRAVAAFAITLSSSPRYGRCVRHLAIIPHHSDAAMTVHGGSGAGRDPEDYGAGAFSGVRTGVRADAILPLCPNATHLLLSRSMFDDWSPGLYSTASAREVSLIGVGRASDLDGLVSRHRQTMTAALQNNPTIQALLNNSSMARPTAGESSGGSASDGLSPAQADTSSSSSGSGSSDSRGRPSRPSATLSLTHLHLANFDGRLVHHLAQLTSLTHIVLSYPRSPPVQDAAADGPILPRSHLLLLLGSGRIRRIVIRASPSTCHRILEEIAPIRDDKLVIRPVRLPAGEEVGQRRQYRGNADTRAAATNVSSSHVSSGSSSSAGGSSEPRRGVGEVDLLAEWWERIHLDALQHHRGDRPTAWASSSSSRGRGDSLSSSEMDADSSWSSAEREPGSNGDAGFHSGSGSSGRSGDARTQSGSAASGSGSGSGSYDSDVYSDDDDGGGGTDADADGSAGYDAHGAFRAWPPGPTHSGLPPRLSPRIEAGLAAAAATAGQAMPAQAAPPPRIPIEMLLAYEDLEQARQRRNAGLLVPSVRRRSASRSDDGRRRIRPGAFAARRSDVRGATDAGLERIASLLALEVDSQERHHGDQDAAAASSSEQ
ncbi:uncharacterized protein PFL1_06540 [Pseudozyma flocculosa PF-1]|uniref:Uncharacterized protein n=2 Tax=Pseudozyma flocculosa TaxID=84751 RepID=A0A5C3FAD3_9BASI|nr:uncharacterized protein PFL1_06540 [Pseudozyma flocculosa PF-1]EPQ25866.1 hypothetical protein PFL1_06540 [Pseudozyma flocculosa PF-1]SPO40635.1 uncharacterized protein PSFLO_06117 [Pseudozyma flocculosa]